MQLIQIYIHLCIITCQFDVRSAFIVKLLKKKKYLSRIKMWGKKIIIVTVLPDEGPRITGGRSRYQVGEIVRMNCTSAPSKPAALLTWFINGDQVNGLTKKKKNSIVIVSFSLRFHSFHRHENNRRYISGR